MLVTDYIKRTMTMVTRYRLFLYKLFTMPNVEGIQSSVFSAFLGMIMLQAANLATLFMFIRSFYPMDVRSTGKFLIAGVICLPPIVLNYYFIYYKNGYKKILKEHSSIKKGSLKHITVYLVITLVAMVASVYLIED